MDAVHGEYEDVLKAYTTNGNVEECCRSLGFSKPTFYRRRYIAELKIADPDAFELLKSQPINSTVRGFNEACKNRLLEIPNIAALRREGNLLP